MSASRTARRLLIVTPRSPLLIGGVERHVREVSVRCAAAGMAVQVLCAEPGARTTEDHSVDGVRVRSVPAYPAGTDWLWAPSLWREIAAADADIVHVQSYHTLVAPLAMARARRLGRPYVLTFHGGGSSSGMRNDLRSTQRRLQRRLYVDAARLVAVAQFEIDRYARELAIDPRHFRLIPNGTDLALTAPGATGATGATGLTGLTDTAGTADTGAATDTAGTGGAPGTAAPACPRDGETLLASIGRLERYKGHQRAIAALVPLLALRPHTRLRIVGEGPYEPELRRLAADSGVGDRVEFTRVPPGDAPAMAALLAGVDLVVLLSEFETHPLVALEAAAMRRRLVVADTGGLGELAAGGFGRAVSLALTAPAIAEVIDAELARPGPAHAPELFSWDDCATALMTLYDEILTR